MTPLTHPYRYQLRQAEGELSMVFAFLFFSRKKADCVFGGMHVMRAFLFHIHVLIFKLQVRTHVDVL